MKIDYDKEADAIYIELNHGEFSKNKKLDDFTIIDIDKDGNIIGIELLDVSKRMTIEEFSRIKVNNIEVEA